MVEGVRPLMARGYPKKHPVDWMGKETNEIRKAKISSTLRLWESEIKVIEPNEFQQLLLKLNDGVRIW